MSEKNKFCPKCRSEYLPHIHVCHDCNVPLVQDLPPEPQPEYIEYEELLSTYNIFDVALIKSILDGEDITYYFHGEHFAQVRPFVEPSRLMVKKDQVDEAKEILKDLNLSFVAFTGEREEPEGPEDPEESR